MKINKPLQYLDNGGVYFIVVVIWLIVSLIPYFLETKTKKTNLDYPYLKVSDDGKTVKVFHKNGVVVYNFDERKTILENEKEKK